MKNRSHKPTGRPPGRSGRNTRDSILGEAVQLFARQGVAATTFAKIAKRAGVTPAMMHYYFSGREELLDAVVEARLAPVAARVWNPLREGGSAPEMVRAFVHGLVHEIETKPWIPPTWIREVLNEGGLLRHRMLRHIPREKVRILCAAITQGQTAGTINREIDPLLLVFSMLGLVMMHAATVNVFGSLFRKRSWGTKDLERHITALLLRGLRSEGDVSDKTRQHTRIRHAP